MGAAPLGPEAERMPDWRRRGWFEASELRGSDQKRSRDHTSSQEPARSPLSTPPSVRAQQRQSRFWPGKRRAVVLRDGVDVRSAPVLTRSGQSHSLARAQRR